jgi:hypothetical protein
MVLDRLSKARGLCPLDPHQGLRPWNLVPVGEERGTTTEMFQRPLAGPSLHRPESGSKGSALSGVQGQSPWPYLKDLTQ